MRIAFMGTPEFAVPSLKALYEAGHETAVFTQPDRAKGRGYNVQFPHVKEYALSVGLPVFQFERIKRPEGVAAIREFAPELMVTAAFGQILSAEILSIPKHGCINVHGSLQPKYPAADRRNSSSSFEEHLRVASRITSRMLFGVSFSRNLLSYSPSMQNRDSLPSSTNGIARIVGELSFLTRGNGGTRE